MNEKLREMLVKMGMDPDEDAKTFARVHGIAIVDGQASAPSAADRAKEINEMYAMANAHKVDLAKVRAAVEAGQGKAEFAETILRELGAKPAPTSAEIGLSKKEVRRYSLRRAILAMRERNRDLAPFEMEVSGACETLMRQAAQGFFMPTDIMGRDLEAKPEDVAKVREAMANLMQNRNLTAGTDSAGGYTVATDLLSGSFIDILRHQLVLAKLGVTMLTGLVGDIAIPKQTGASGYYFVTEGNAPTQKDQTFGQVTMTPKHVGGRTAYSRQLLLQSSISVEQFITGDLAAVIAQGMQYAALLGSGSGGQPTGLATQTGISTVAIGTNGGVPTWPHIVALETQVCDDNVLGAMAYLTNARVRGQLKVTQKFSSTNGMEVWEGSKGPDGQTQGELNGYAAYVSNMVPHNLAKGSGTDLSAIYFGNWADMLLGLWGVLDILVDPYSDGDAGNTKVRALQAFDVNFRRVQSFAKIVDAATTNSGVS